MQANHHRNIKSGKEYDYLFPQAKGGEITIKWNANVHYTLEFIPKMVAETLNDTKELSKLLKGTSDYETCRNIWDFVYNHIQYHHDEEGLEQVRRPARTWMDRVRGVDCDCYTVFISSILSNLQIEHTYRITKYKHKTYFQHIYPIVPTADGNYITMDCVVNEFNHEEPFTQKKDSPMNLTYLNGIDTEEENKSLMAISPNSDLAHLPDFQDFDGFGKLNVGKAFKDVLHVTNIVNPATTLLRLGVLASMKLNLFQIAKRLRYAYLTDEKAKEMNLDMDKLHKLKNILKKMEDIFYGAGGKPESLKKAILTGHGNKDHAVSGFGETDDFSGAETIDELTPLKELLSGLYEDEYPQAKKEVEGLGDPATGTAIAAATTVMTAIAAILKSVGNIKKGGAASTNSTDNTPATTDNETDNGGANNGLRKKSDGGSAALKSSDDTSTDTTDAAKPATFMERAKTFVKEHPVKTAVAVVGTGALIFGVIKLVQHSKKKHKQPALSGAPHHRHKHKHKKHKAKHHKHKKAPIALL